MRRREALKLSGLGIGITLSGATLLSLVTSCKQDIKNELATQVFDLNQLSFLSELSETILPRTETPGAKDLNVAAFLDHFVNKLYDLDNQASFKSNLEELMKQCQELNGRSLAECSGDEKHAFVRSLESSDLSPSMSIWGNTVTDGSDLPFYKQLKSMIMFAFFSDEKIGKEVLTYQPLAPGYQGCVDLLDDTTLPSI